MARMETRECERRQKFYAHYWGQKCLVHRETGEEKAINHLCDIKDVNYVLGLRSLSSLTIGEAKDLAELMGLNQQMHLNEKAKGMLYIDVQKTLSGVKEFSRMSLAVADYLRQNRFLIPFRGYSIESLLESGWCILIE